MSTKPYLKGPSGALKADSNWLGVSDLPYDRDTVVTIEHAIQIDGEKISGSDAVNGGGLKFVGAKKQWILPAICRKTLERLFTTEVANWRGQEIALYIDPSVWAFGVNTGGVRIRDEKVEAHRKRVNELAGGEAPEEPTADDAPPAEEPFSLGNSDVCAKPCGDTNAEEPEKCGLDAGHEGECEARD